MPKLNIGLNSSPELILQTEAAECGLACLAMVSAIHGRHIGLRGLRQRFGVSLMGMTLYELARSANSINFATRALRAEPQELKNLVLPCILHFDLNHFVVLFKVSKSHFIVLDPAYGLSRLKPDAFSSRFTGVLLELTPNRPFAQRRKRQEQAGVSRLLGYVRGSGTALVWLLALSAVIEAFGLLVPSLNRWAIDEAMVTGDLQLLYTIGAGLLALAASQTIAEATREFALLRLGAIVSVQWFSRVYSRLINLPIEYFSRRQLGDVLARSETVSTIQTTISAGFLDGIIDGVMALGTLGVMTVYSARLTAISAGILSVYVLLRAAVYRVVRGSSQSQFVFGARWHTYLIETIRGIRTIKQFGKEQTRITGLMNRVILTKNAALRIGRYNAVFRLANTALFRCEAVVVLALAGVAVIDKSFTVGMFVAFTAYREQFARKVSSLVDRVFEFKMLSVQTDRLADIMLERPEQLSRSVSVPTEEKISDLTVSKVSFRYSSDLPFVIKGVTIRIKAGEHVVIVGPSGCGKTTLLNLLTGFYDVNGGSICYGNTPINLLGQSYRDICATISQDDVLFAGSVAENITFFDERPDHDFMRRCAVIAGIHSEIQSMPMGYETLVGDMGSVLSGGQKQRVILARALYRRPKILFLDEATSHLDAANERQIMSFISQMQITRISIAHRAETVASADRIIDIGIPRRPESESYD